MRKFCGRHGFTLLELVLALGIFLILTVVVIDVFLSSSREERRGLAREQIVASGRAALEQITRDIRLGLTPSAGFNVLGACDSLASVYCEFEIRFADGSSTQYGFILLSFDPRFEQNLVTCHSPQPGVRCDLFGPTPTFLLTQAARVTAMTVRVSPVGDPFAPGSSVNQQPLVTISLTLQGTGPRPEEQLTTTLQTSVASRHYER